MRKNRKNKLFFFGTAMTGMHLVNKYLSKTTPPLMNVLEGEENYFFSQYGKIHYTKKGTGEPLLLLHGVASGVSSFQWRNNFDALGEHFTVYALDLPGFGKSQKLAITYRSSIYQNVIRSFIKEVIGEPANVIASLQSAAYMIQLEHDNPGFTRAIIAVCPTGVFELSLPPGRSGRALHYLFKSPLAGTFLYNLLVSNAGRHYYIKNQSYYNKSLATPRVLKHYRISSRQNGYLSKFAPASFIGGYLNQNISEALHNIKAPLFIIWGRNAKMNSVNNLQSFLDLKSDTKYYVFDNCGVLPQEEYPDKFNELCIEFLKNGK